MKNANKRFLHKVLIILIVVVLACLYFSGLLNTVLKTGRPSYNPIVMIQCALQYGFPMGLFIMLLLCFLGGSVVALIRLWKEMQGMDKLGRRFKTSQKRQVYGDAHFEEPEEYRKAALVESAEDAYGTILGQIDESGTKVIDFRMDRTNRLNQHIMVVGSSGSGKTYTFSINYCLQAVKRRESVIITDPDGGLTRDTAQYFRDHGYVVRVLNLKNLKKSDGWDCLKSVRNGDVMDKAQQFAETVIANVADTRSAEIFKSGPKNLLKALIIRVLLGHDYPEEDKNIGTVYELMQNVKGEEYLDKIFLNQAFEPDEADILKAYMAYRSGSDNLRGNLFGGLTAQLQVLQSSLVLQVLSTNDIDLTLPGQQPCAYFCQFPDSHDTYKFITALFFSMLFMSLINFADEQDDGRLPIPVNFLLDEFPSIGVLPDFDRKISTVRKRSINIAMILQDITQLQNNYHDRWVTLLANCSTFLSLGINDEFTSNLVSKRIGETTIEVQTQQHSAIESVFVTAHPHSSGEGKRMLLNYDELFKLGENDSIILFQNHNPIMAKKFPYPLHPEAKKLKRTYLRDTPDITDTEAREELRKREKEFIARYMVEHPLSAVDRSYTEVGLPKEEIEGLPQKIGKRLRLAKRKADLVRWRMRSHMVDKDSETDSESDDEWKKFIPDAAVTSYDEEFDAGEFSAAIPLETGGDGVSIRVVQDNSHDISDETEEKNATPGVVEPWTESEAADNTFMDQIFAAPIALLSDQENPSLDGKESQDEKDVIKTSDTSEAEVNPDEFFPAPKRKTPPASKPLVTGAPVGNSKSGPKPRESTQRIPVASPKNVNQGGIDEEGMAALLGAMRGNAERQARAAENTKKRTGNPRHTFQQR